MSIEQLEQAAAQLGTLRRKMAFLGGAAMALWITEPAAPPLRPTKDVDVLVEVGSTVAYYRLGEELRERGFAENPHASQICAWRHVETGLELDVMPTDPDILGFSNEWHPAALAAAVRVNLPSGKRVQAVPPPHLLATKIEAFRGRQAPPELRAYLARQLGRMREDFAFESGVAGALLPDPASQARASVVLRRMQQVIESAP